MDSEDLKKLNHDLKHLDYKSLDVILIVFKKFLNAIAKGRDLHFFERIMSEVVEIIYKIKEERLLKKQ